MADKGSGHTSSSPKNRTKVNKERKHHGSQLQEIAARIKELDETIKSLHFKVPEKEKFAKEKIEISQSLNEIKCKRESEFTEKRSIDTALKTLSIDITAKFDAIGKLKSKLRYKTQGKVDEVIIKLEKQLPKLKMKPLEQRRIEQEISDLKGSKEKIVEYRKLEDEVHILKERQKELRSLKDENIKKITAVKQEEAATKALFDNHKRIENEAWDVYKRNLSKRDILRNERDELQKRRRGLTEKHRKENDILKTKNDLDKINSRYDTEDSGKDVPGHVYKAKSVIEKKKPFEKEINYCDILLSILDKYTYQHQSIPVTEERKDLQNINPTSEPTDTVDGKSSKTTTDDLYRGIKRRPSKKERRRRQHTSELSKKIDLHVTVLERFVFLGINPPSTLADCLTASTQLQDKKKSFFEDQQKVLKQSEIRRAKSIPSLGSEPTKSDDGLSKLGQFNNEVNVTNHDLPNKNKSLGLNLSRRHKSCPSLVSDIAAELYIELESPSSSTNKDWSSNASDYELDSPISNKSSASFVDRDTRANSLDRDYITADVEGEKVGWTTKIWKSHHKVHFSSDVEGLDAERSKDQIKENVTENTREELVHRNEERFNEQGNESIKLNKQADDEMSDSLNPGCNKELKEFFDGHVDNEDNKLISGVVSIDTTELVGVKTDEKASMQIDKETNEHTREKGKMEIDFPSQRINSNNVNVSDFGQENNKMSYELQGTFSWNKNTETEMIFDIEMQNIDRSKTEDESRLSTELPVRVIDESEPQIMEFNPGNMKFKSASKEIFQDENSKIDSFVPEEQASNVENANNIDLESESLEENKDDFLQFPIDGLCDVDTQFENPNRNEDFPKSYGIRISDAFAIPSCASASSCSPRKSNYEFRSVDQNNDDGVPVKI